MKSEPLPEILSCDPLQFTEGAQRLRYLREHLVHRVDDRHFDMSCWIDGRSQDSYCNTVGCIGGWAEVLFFPPDKNVLDDHVAKSLGLTVEQGLELFYMYDTEYSFHDVTRQLAVDHLDHIIETGEVNWDLIIDGR